MASRKERQKERFERMMKQAESGEIMDLDGLGGGDGVMSREEADSKEVKGGREKYKKMKKEGEGSEKKRLEVEKRMREFEERSRVEDERSRVEAEERKKGISKRVVYKGVVYKDFEAFSAWLLNNRR